MEIHDAELIDDDDPGREEYIDQDSDDLELEEVNTDKDDGEENEENEENGDNQNMDGNDYN